MTKIFLSYARQDASEAVHRLRSELELAGFTVWRDSEDMRGGELWKEQLRTALREVDVVLVLLTPASVISEYVSWEWENALTLQKRIIPLLIIPCTVPDELRRLHYHDLSEPGKYNSGFAALIRDLVALAISKPVQRTQTTSTNASKYTVYNAQQSAIGDNATVFNTNSPILMNPSRAEANLNLESGPGKLKQQAQEAEEHNPWPHAQSMIDVAIVIALKEEFTELYHEIEKRYIPIHDPETGNYHYQFDHLSADSNQGYRCIAAFVGEMGPGKAGLLTQRLISKWQPRTLVMLGIAAALNSDVQVGDVVIASQVDAYLEKSKAVEATYPDEYTFMLSGDVYRSSSDLINLARNFEFVHRKSFHDWQTHCTSELEQLLSKESISKESVKELIDKGLLGDQAQIIDGHIASGPTVGASKAFTHWLKTRDRKYLALEMEAAGFMMAVYEQADPQRTLVLRGISDYGDERKSELDSIGNGSFRRWAMRNAIQLLWKFLNADLLPHVSPSDASTR